MNEILGLLTTSNPPPDAAPPAGLGPAITLFGVTCVVLLAVVLGTYLLIMTRRRSRHRPTHKRGRPHHPEAPTDAWVEAGRRAEAYSPPSDPVDLNDDEGDDDD